MAFLRYIVLWLVSLITCRAKEVPTDEFLTRPDIIPPAWNVTQVDGSTVSNGYIFLAPEMHAHTNFTRAMYIYNNHGGLVWSGHQFNIPTHRVTIFESCNYSNAPHLCATFYNGLRTGGESFGSFSLIVDNSYHQVQAVAPSYEFDGNILTQGLHEFNLIGNGSTALVSSMASIRRPSAFAHCPGAPTAEYILNSYFTEISTDGTNTTFFHWDAMDHVAMFESATCPEYPNSGSGESLEDGVDFFHINAVDKNEDGDYLVSGRHTNTVYKIAGIKSPSGQRPGSVIWRLGGRGNDFHLHNRTTKNSSGAFRFSFQHHSRFSQRGIRIFDNANSEIAESKETPMNASAATASGMDIEIDEEARTANLVYQAIPPSGQLSSSQGSHQKLPDGNHFCGLGSENEVYERTPDGTLAFNAYIGGQGLVSYRALKQHWVGNPPVHELRFFMYAHNASAPTASYVSWNGATKVASYRFYASNSSAEDYSHIATVKKGYEFETRALDPSFHRYGYAEAYDEHGIILGRTASVKTFVPHVSLASACDHLKCAPYTDYVTMAQEVVALEMKFVNT